VATRGKPFRSEIGYDIETLIIVDATTGLDSWQTVSGTIGCIPIGQDFRRLVPIVFAKMTREERDPAYLIKNGYLEKLEDYVYEEEGPNKGKLVRASLLGYRITERFVKEFFGRVIKNPNEAIPIEILKPELQGAEGPRIFAESVWNYERGQQEAVKVHYQDGTYEAICESGKVLLDLIRYGQYQGMDSEHPQVQKMLTDVLNLDWYKARLDTLQKERIRALRLFMEELKDTADLAALHEEYARVSSPEYRTALVGTLGINPSLLNN
jgi:hypothetical protein